MTLIWDINGEESGGKRQLNRLIMHYYTHIRLTTQSFSLAKLLNHVHSAEKKKQHQWEDMSLWSLYVGPRTAPHLLFILRLLDGGRREEAEANEISEKKPLSSTWDLASEKARRYTLSIRPNKNMNAYCCEGSFTKTYRSVWIFRWAADIQFH